MLAKRKILSFLLAIALIVPSGAAFAETTGPDAKPAQKTERALTQAEQKYVKTLAYAAALQKARYEAILRLAVWMEYMKRRAAFQRLLDFAAAVEAAKHQTPYGVWDRLAVCESSGNWASSVGSYEGGLQFHPSTWLAMGGGQYARHAYQATRTQQIAVAERLLARAGWGQWPACSRKLGLR